MRAALVLIALLLLGGCKKEEKPINVSVRSGTPVFDGDRNDCATSLTLAPAAPAGQATPIWEASAPLPISNDETCPWRFPIVYGQVPAAIRTYPEAVPRLESGRLYTVFVHGMAANHSAQFRAP